MVQIRTINVSNNIIDKVLLHKFISSLPCNCLYIYKYNNNNKNIIRYDNTIAYIYNIVG